MDLGGIGVVVVLTVLAIWTIVWLETYSRRSHGNARAGERVVSKNDDEALR